MILKSNQLSLIGIMYNKPVMTHFEVLISCYFLVTLFIIIIVFNNRTIRTFNLPLRNRNFPPMFELDTSKKYIGACKIKSTNYWSCFNGRKAPFENCWFYEKSQMQLLFTLFFFFLRCVLLRLFSDR